MASFMHRVKRRFLTAHRRSSEINAMIAQHDVAATAAVVDIGSPDHILTRMLGKSQVRCLV